MYTISLSFLCKSQRVAKYIEKKKRRKLAHYFFSMFSVAAKAREQKKNRFFHTKKECAVFARPQQFSTQFLFGM